MEHILQFGISIDEESIIDAVKDKAAREVMSKIEKQINDYTRGYHSRMEDLFRDEIKKTLDVYKDEIIENATKQLAANMAKTKAVKEMIAKMTE